MNYIPLHVYSGYTFLESSLHIENIFSFAKENHNKYACITDFNSVTQYPHLVNECKNEITPLLGLSSSLKCKLGDFYFCVICKNEDGYKSLCNLLYNKEKLNSKNINDYKKGLIIIIPIISNTIIKEALLNDDTSLSSIIFSIQKGFDDCYIGMEEYTKDDALVLKKGREFALNFGYKAVAFPKAQYLTKEDAISLEILNSIKNNTKLDPSFIQKNGSKFLLTDEFASKIYTEEEILNTQKIALSTSFNFNKKRGKLLNYPVESKKEYLKQLCLNKLTSLSLNKDEKYLSRLNYEIDVIEKMGFIDYFLIVQDYVNYAKNNNIPVGPGRGSACGSLVSYLLQITEIDPLKYNLLFERFLNPERITLPDIDIDISDNRREEVINYIRDRFSFKKVSSIIAIQTIGAKQSLRDIGMVYSFKNQDISFLSSFIKDSKQSLDEACSSTSLKEVIRDAHLNKIFNLAKKIEGLPRQVSIHPAGIIINDEEIDNILPLNKNENGEIVSQYEAPYLENQGFIKMDILGLRTLSLIDNMVNNIPSFSLKNIPLDDEDTFACLNKGLTLGLFQIESEGMTKSIMKVKINSFSDIFAMLSLYRPGPLEQIPLYAERKNNDVKFESIEKDVDEILRPTYGIIIYQEQIMMICQKVASFTFSEADLFRRAISKKDSSKLNLYKDKFINGCINNSLTKEKANELFDLIYRFSDYGFNKSHAVAYSLILYRMGYIKAHHPSSFYKVLLDNEMLTQDTYFKYKKELDYFSLKIELPSINISSNKYIEKDNKLYIPFTQIKGLPLDVGLSIIQERKDGSFTSFFDFVTRIHKYNISEKQIITLIQAGCFDEVEINREKLEKNLKNYINFAQNNEKFNYMQYGDISLFLPNEIEAQRDEAKEDASLYAVLGIRINSNINKKYEDIIKKFNLSTLKEVSTRSTSFIAIISKIKMIKTKKGEQMAILTLYDDASTLKAVLFPQDFILYSGIIYENKPFIFKGYLKIDEVNGSSFIIQKVTKMEVK